MVSVQGPLWDDTPPPRRTVANGEVRRALDRDIRTAQVAGRVFLETELAAARRQANDLDRLERILAGADEPKTWDYNPKTTAHQAYADTIRRLFGEHHDDDDPFIQAVHDLDARAAASAGTPTTLDTPGPQ